MIGWLRHVWRWYKARMRWDLKLVCEMSKGRGTHDDFHDYEDDESYPFPCHMIPYHCSRCGKEFYI